MQLSQNLLFSLFCTLGVSPELYTSQLCELTNFLLAMFVLSVCFVGETYNGEE